MLQGVDHFLAVAVLLLLFSQIPAAVATQSFSRDVPQQPYDMAYRAYFRNYDTAGHCILRDVITPTEASRGGIMGEYWGCAGGGGREGAHSLLLLKADELEQLKLAECRPTMLVSLLGAMKPPLESGVKGFGIVALGEGKVRSECDIKCLLDAAKQYNTLQLTERNRLLNITAVLYSDDTQQCSSSCNTSCGSGDPLLIPHVVRSSYDFEVLYIASNSPSVERRSASDRGEWAALVEAATFNRQRWVKTPHPYNVVETRSGGELAPHMTSISALTDCLNGASLPRCSPLGGWTVWASNADTKWEWSGGNTRKPSFVKKTRKGAIAIMVASTAVSLVHGTTPGADCPASGIVAALAVMDVLKRVLDGIKAPSRDVYAFFFPGEHVGSIGSSRFVSDAMQLACAYKGLKSCSVAYGGNLNFTTVDFDSVDTFVSFDQVAIDGSPLFYHVDSRASAASRSQVTAQAEAEAALEKASVSRAATRQLPYSPITTVLDLLGKSTIVKKTFLTLTRYNTTYANPNVFTVRDSMSHNDSVSLSAESVAEAADALLRVVLPGVAVGVDRTLVHQLWECFTVNTKCSFLERRAVESGSPVGIPDYSVGVLGNSVTTNPTAVEEAIQASLKHIGWEQPMLSAAVPRGLKFRDEEKEPLWKLDEDWLNQTVYRSARYALHVVSGPQMSFGARGAMIGPYWESVVFFAASVLTCVLGYLYLNRCLRKTPAV
ncbi:Nicastrin, putative [Trypanosoma equiperdum]|uniref:Nicastrin, putative n=1 Tax=Trypanosoma equiperdum TaxID=5694 RepID=A0A1G4IHE4_TRYEQ|nr:Nicastrin, putative [Trypanosoma equiperdum]